MWALTVAVIYFGSFIALGYLAKLALNRFMTGSELVIDGGYLAQ